MPFLIAAAIGVFIVSAALALRWRCYVRWFRLPTRRSDLLVCRSADSQTVVTLDANGVDLPPLELANHTVLLRVFVSPRWSGHLIDPHIEMRIGDTVLRQYFERGATGERYLNLSPLFRNAQVPAAARAELRARGLRWQAQGLLQAFSAPRFDGARVLVLAPHPDDAELAAFGLYANCDAWVATLTAGDNLGVGAAANSLRRVGESLTVPQLAALPAARVINLAFPDSALQAMHRNPAASFRLACEQSIPRARLRALNSLQEFREGTADCRWPDLVSELRALLVFVKPDVVVAPHPLLDSHADHVFAAVALQAAMNQSGIFPELLLYAVHIAGSPMHPLGDEASVVALPPQHHAEWIAEQIYSHTLAPAERAAKRRSLAAMSAIRSSAGLEPGLPAASFLEVWKNRVAGIDARPASLLRRAARPNEIYYRMRGHLLAELLERPQPSTT